MTQSAPTVPHSVPSRDESWVYFDGEIRRYGDSRLGILTHALHYGTGCFEGIRAYWVEEQQQLFALRMPEHYDRMRSSAKVLLMELPLGTEELCSITTELLRRNGWRQDIYIRPLLYKSSEEIGVRLHGLKDGFLIVTAPFGAYVDIDNGIRCMVSSWRRVDDNVAPARSKCTGIYVNSALAKTEAMQNGYDEAIMLTHDGHVSEGSAENIFIVRNGALITPPESDNILEGITRATLIHLATEEMGLDVVQRQIDRSELYVADEVFLCGTGAQVSPVIEIDRRRIGDGEPGPLTSRIQADYFAICKGRNPKYRDWLTAIY
ncbi:MAG TPA: branched-chain amino acid transaminase, partial [Candidatus Dormibacteraeota bacterium]|jgi:branched-chain amino acid aminotransferase|nr:branched-chain amino acid transaminase [Candidatus Dormibacteraeota bacterium]